MSTNVTRGGLTYTIPSPVAAGVSQPTGAQVQTLTDIVLDNIEEFFGINAVSADPAINVDMVIPKGATYPVNAAVPEASRYSRRRAYTNADIVALRDSFGSGTKLSVDNIDNLINTCRWYQSTGVSLVSSLGGVTMDNIPMQAANGAIDDAVFNAIAANMTKVSEHLNTYNGYWNGDLCARTCQVNCQTACQTACQGCNNSTCHNQNCGGWS